MSSRVSKLRCAFLFVAILMVGGLGASVALLKGMAQVENRKQASARVERGVRQNERDEALARMARHSVLTDLLNAAELRGEVYVRGPETVELVVPAERRGVE